MKRIYKIPKTRIIKGKHYELVKVYKNTVQYKCLETGRLEHFTKNDFITKEEQNEYTE